MSTETAAPDVHEPEVGIEPDDLDTKTIVVVGLISTALLVASVLGMTAFVDYFKSVEVAEKVYEKPGDQSYGDPLALLGAQREELASFDTSPAGEGRYRIPIERAKQLVLEELQAGRGSAD